MKSKQKKHQQIPEITQGKVATPETPQTDGRIRTETDAPAPTDRAGQIRETDHDQETDPHQGTEPITDRHETESREAGAANPTEVPEAPEITEKDQQAETDHLIATEIHIQAAAADTDQAAETDIHETKHLPITDHQEIRTTTDQSQDQATIQEAPETDPYQETDTPTDHEDPIPEIGTTTENNAVEHQTAKVQKGHNHPTKIKQLYQG